LERTTTNTNTTTEHLATFRNSNTSRHATQPRLSCSNITSTNVFYTSADHDPDFSRLNFLRLLTTRVSTSFLVLRNDDLQRENLALEQSCFAQLGDAHAGIRDENPSGCWRPARAAGARVLASASRENALRKCFHECSMQVAAVPFESSFVGSDSFPT
jgi:hypothetical protein